MNASTGAGRFWFSEPFLPTPDGVRYLSLGKGEAVPRPFHLRWFIPFLCRSLLRLWMISSVVSVIVIAVGTGLLAPTWQTGLAAGLMFVALPIVRYNLDAVTLVDLPAMAFAVAAALVGWWPAAIVLSLLAGASKESGPVFAALYAWNPVLLVGLVAPAFRALLVKPGPDPLAKWKTAQPASEHQWILEHPFQAGWKYHRKKLLHPATMVLPWGGALVAFGNLDLQTIVVLAVAYGQLAVATDSVRLYQWAAPVVLVTACTAVPVAWLPLLVILTIWNPHAGNGV